MNFEEAIYILAKVGGKPTTYNTGKGSKIFTVPLIFSSVEIFTVKAFSVESILPPISRISPEGGQISF